MPIIGCPSCTQALQVGDEFFRSGKDAKCPKCNNRFPVATGILHPASHMQTTIPSGPPQHPKVQGNPLNAARQQVEPFPASFGDSAPILSTVAQVPVTLGKPNSSMVKIVGLVVFGIGLMGIGGFVTTLVARSSLNSSIEKNLSGTAARLPQATQTPNVSNTDDVSSGTHTKDSRQTSSLKENENRESNELRKELQKLRQEKDDLESQKKKLDQQMKELQDQIRNLVSQSERLREWQTMSLVVYGAPGAAIGFVDTGKNDLLVKRRVDDHFSVAALRAAENASVPRIRMDSANMRVLLASIKEGDPAPSNCVQEIEKYWKPQRFFTIDDDSNHRLVTFQDATAKNHRVAFFSNAKNDSLEYQAFSKTTATVQRAQLIPGTVRIGNGAEIKSILQHGEFIDYCLLNIAQKCETKDRAQRLLMIKVLSELGKNETVNYVSEISSAFGFQNSKAVPISDLCSYIEDGAVAKLTSLGLRVIERERIGELLAERKLLEDKMKLVVSELGIGKSPDGWSLSSNLRFERVPSEFGRDNFKYQRLLTATHLVLLEIKPPIEGGLYHVSCRLIDVDSGEVAWSDDGEQNHVTPTNAHFTSDGRIARVTFKQPPAMPSSFRGVEDPPVIPFPSMSNAKSFVVAVDKISPEGDVTYRPLFQRNRIIVPKQLVTSIVDADYIEKADQVPTPERLRYVAYRILTNTLPPAGKINFVDGNQAVVNLGARHGVKTGDRLRVMRYSNPSTAKSPASSPGSGYLLSTELVVTDTSDLTCKAFKEVSGTENYWTGDSEIVSDDLAIVKFHQRPRIFVPIPAFEPPQQKLAVQMNYDNPLRAQRLRDQALEAAREVVSTVTQAFDQFQAEVINDVDKPSGFSNEQSGRVRRPTSPATAEQKLTNEITHTVSSSITHLAEGKYHVRLAVRPAHSQELAEQLEFTYMKATRK